MPRFYPHPIIAREGWPFISAGLVLSIIVTACAGWWSLPFWLFTAFALQFFRDPSRPIPQDADAVLCPADGRIVVVEKVLDPYRNVEALKISVFMNVFNVHSQRAPVDGTITGVEYNKGKFVNAALDKASTENERNAVLATTRSGREITFVQVAGLVARRILCYIGEGEKVVRGERYGFIRFGSRVDVYLPTDARAEVAIGDKVSASSTILARLPLSAPAAEPEPQTVATPDAAATAAAAAALTPIERAGENGADAAETKTVAAAQAGVLDDEQQIVENIAEEVRTAAEQAVKQDK
ncbi:phosphatidylserine decarboxylase [Uruburuella suis]|uniref:Phosphatidylserine decarboxylase proenzyme n=1 Tax=Uruburuella suis TaxID=252130 RepID=A0AAE9GVM3_9NEIS|nr:phosphatidylserine decarboxylase [Uruburuella suis]MBP6393163.1 phosphatidylserine decarboxylase [Neisseria sp.]TCP02799.1 phosphatidylserine decarboxylase [Uruburuella suis]UOO78623.1 phosphatidylserine decarboxylase [Uruburuella suis]